MHARDGLCCDALDKHTQHSSLNHGRVGRSEEAAGEKGASCRETAACWGWRAWKAAPKPVEGCQQGEGQEAQGTGSSRPRRHSWCAQTLGGMQLFCLCRGSWRPAGHHGGFGHACSEASQGRRACRQRPPPVPPAAAAAAASAAPALAPPNLSPRACLCSRRRQRRCR